MITFFLIVAASLIVETDGTSNRTIDRFEREGFRCNSYNEFGQIKKHVDENNGQIKDEVIFLDRDSVLFGFVYFDDQLPMLLIADQAVLMVFFSTPIGNVEESLYDQILNNLYSCYQVQFETKEVSHISFNFGFPRMPTIEKYIRIDSDSVISSKLMCDKHFEYPDFRDTTRLRITFENFARLQLSSCSGNQKSKQRHTNGSNIVRLLNRFIRE